MKKIIAIFIVCLTLLSCLSVPTLALTDTDDAPYESYTYWTGLGGGSRKPVQIKSLYEVDRVVYSEDMGAEDIEAFTDICCDSKGNVYILEGKTSKIFILNNELTTQKVITQITKENGETVDFKGSEGIFVDSDGHIYIAASEKQLVFKIDNQGNVVKEYVLPDSNIIPSDFRYRPIKVTVDSRGYIYILSEGSYYGAILYSPDDEFLGFYGANSVTSTLVEAISGVFKKLFVNDVKKEQSMKSLPYQFTDLVVDSNNFIYTVTGTTKAGAKGQVRRLNPSGKNVLASDNINYADDNASIKIGESWKGVNLARIAVSGDFIYALDCSFGKVFLYNVKNELMGVFGGGLASGNQKGTFVSAAAIDVYEDTVYIIDSKKNCLTVFKPTEHGRQVMTASSKVIRSDYIGAQADWEAVLRQDSNYQHAYRYIAKAEYTKGNYTKSMEYAKKGADRSIYSQAFEVYRNKLLKANFGLVVLILFVIVLLIIALMIFKRKSSKVFIRSEKFKLMLKCLFHPFDSFNEVKYKNKGSVSLAAVIMILYFVTEVLKVTKGGFIYTYFDAANFNALFVLLRTMGIILLWTVINWAVSTLFGGIGRIKEIYIVACYSLLPIIFGNVVSVFATNLLTESEAQFLGVLTTVLMLCTFVLIAIGTIIIHDFDFGHFVGTTVLTLLGMVIVVFVVFIAWLIVQQLFGFILTISNEIIYR